MPPPSWCFNTCPGHPEFADDGVCDDGGPGAVYSNCPYGTDCADCSARFHDPPAPPPQPPSAPPPPPPSPPPLSHVRRFPAAPAATGRKYRGEFFAGDDEGLGSSGHPALPLLDWDLVPVSVLSTKCAYGRKFHNSDACPPLSPFAGPTAHDAPSAARGTLYGAHRAALTPDFSGASTIADYVVNKPVETPSLPWYGYPLATLDDAPNASNTSYGAWSQGPSSLIAHRGYLVSLHGGWWLSPQRACPMRAAYLRPNARLWRLERCASSQVPAWVHSRVGNQGVLHAPGTLFDPTGQLPNSQGRRVQHVAVYYSTALPGEDNTSACIGRMTARWPDGDDAMCAPTLGWEDDGQPVLCSNLGGSASAASDAQYATSEEWKSMSGGEALAYGAEPFWGFDGSVYMVYGAREPGNIRIVQLNESSGRLPLVALPGHRPGDTNLSNDHVYHHVASGPSFELGQDALASPYDAAAYIGGKVRPHNENRSFVQNAYVLPSNATGSAQYFLFVDWYLPHGDGTVHNSTTRVHVGRSTEPTGPFYDRDGFDLKERRPVILGGDRTIAVHTAVWGANCDGGVGYDILAAAKKNCDGLARCDWALTYMELDPIDPEAYSNMENQYTSWQDQYSDTPENYPDEPGCLRAVNISYLCTGDSGEQLLYEHETLGAMEHVHVPAEAANGSIAVLECTTPSAIMLPGGSLFADSQALGGSLHFTGPSHSGVFTYDKDGQNRTARKAQLEELLANHMVSGGHGPHRLDGNTVERYTKQVAALETELARLERRYVFTFQYTTPRSTTPEIGARRLFFEADGWPTLDQDVSQEWKSCSERGDLPFPLEDLAGIPTAPSYTSSSSTRTHCTYHSNRAGHCVGNSLRASHPLLGTVLPEEPAMVGSIDVEGTAAWWRERRDKCDPRVETVLGEKLECTRDQGERLQVCKPRLCDLPGQKCKKLPQRGVAYWDSADVFDGGIPVYLTSSGYQYSTTPVSTTCEATPHVSEIEPAIGIAEGGTAVTVRGTGFGEPVRCRFGHLETQGYNVTAHSVQCPPDRPAPDGCSPPTPLTARASPCWQVICPSPALRGVLELGFTRFTLEAQMRIPVQLEVSMMSRAVLTRTPLKQRICDARGDNFTRDQVVFQVSHGPRPFSKCSSALSLSMRFCYGSITTLHGCSCHSCGPKVVPRQAALTLTSAGSGSFRAAHRRCR